MTKKPDPSSAPEHVHGLVKKSLESVADIEESAEELGVVHSVLKTELKTNKASADAQLAVERAKEIKQQLEETAGELEKAAKILRDQLPEQPK